MRDIFILKILYKKLPRCTNSSTLDRSRYYAYAFSNKSQFIVSFTLSFDFTCYCNIN